MGCPYWMINWRDSWIFWLVQYMYMHKQVTWSKCFLLHLEFSIFDEILEAEFSACTFCVFDCGTNRWQIMKRKRRKDHLWLTLSKISWKLSFKMLCLMAMSKFLTEISFLREHEIYVIKSALWRASSILIYNFVFSVLFSLEFWRELTRLIERSKDLKG